MQVPILDHHQQVYPHLVELIDSMRIYNSEKYDFLVSMG